MAATITWEIAQLDCYPQVDGLPNVVFTIHWRVFAVDGDYMGSCYGTVGVALDPDAPYTPYEQLTQDQVLTWAKAAIGNEGVAGYEFSALSQIERQQNPPVVNPPLPWVEPAAPSE